MLIISLAMVVRPEGQPVEQKSYVEGLLSRNGTDDGTCFYGWASVTERLRKSNQVSQIT